MRTVLAIGGSDPSGGAGIQADLKTFAAHGVFGLSAVTAVTAQNSLRVLSVEPVSSAILSAQIEAVAEDVEIHAVKIGMLATAAIVDAVADALERFNLPNVVLDPVLSASAGGPLLDEAGVGRLKARLLRLAAVVTPNAGEAEALTSLKVRRPADACAAAERLVALGARAAVVTGGHFEGPPIDVLLHRGTITEFAGDRIATRHTHGTGCTFASAIAARLALGAGLEDAVRDAKAYVARALQQAPGLGRGRGPLGHL